MICKKFTVTGLNPTTNRKNTKGFRAFDEADCKQQVLDSGLLEPFEILEVSDILASDDQLDYARDLSILPATARLQQELTDLLAFQKNHDQPAHASLKQWAEDLAIEHSQYAGQQQLASQVLYKVSPETQIAFFIHAINRLNKGEAIIALVDEPQKKVFDDFVFEMMGDPKFVDSFSRLLREHQHDTYVLLFSDQYLDKFFSSKAYAFEKCENYLRYKFSLTKRRKPSINKTPEMLPQSVREHTSSKSKGKGCLGTVLFLAIFIFLVTIILT